MTYHNLLIQAEKRLLNSAVSENTAKFFLNELCNERNLNLYLLLEDEADREIEQIFNRGIDRLLNNEPLAYILGYQWFYGRKFSVDSDVFIPRYETEELCAEVLSRIDDYFPEGEISVCDVACGSGAIGITLKCEEERIRGYCTELSETAIEKAKLNAKDNQAEITFYQGDLLEPLKEHQIKLDVLVCNPPYIVDNITLDASVVDYEPHMALFGGKDGLDFYRRLLKEGKEVIKEKALIAFEIGYDQKEALLQLANEYFPGNRAEVIKDLNGKDRMFFLYYHLD